MSQLQRFTVGRWETGSPFYSGSLTSHLLILSEWFWYLNLHLHFKHIIAWAPTHKTSPISLAKSDKSPISEIPSSWLMTLLNRWRLLHHPQQSSTGVLSTSITQMIFWHEIPIGLDEIPHFDGFWSTCQPMSTPLSCTWTPPPSLPATSVGRSPSAPRTARWWGRPRPRRPRRSTAPALPRSPPSKWEDGETRVFWVHVGGHLYI